MARKKITQAEADRRIAQAVQTILWVVFSILILGGAAAYLFWFRPTPVDKTTLCPATGPTGHIVLLVDKTDPLNFTQRQAFAVTLRELIEKKTPQGYLLSVFVLGEDFKATAAPLLELCNPGTGSDRSQWTANLKRVRDQYEQKFVKPMLEQSDVLTATVPSKASPIFEMVQLAAINGFKKHDVKGEHRLIIMSDMLHNTPQFTMYKGAVDFQAFANSDYGRKTRADLPDTSVELIYLMNSPQQQTKRNLNFWEEYFKKAGARIVAVQPLEG
jgi:hypothetical protein